MGSPIASLNPSEKEGCAQDTYADIVLHSMRMLICMIPRSLSNTM
jgi:hypothetical protein